MFLQSKDFQVLSQLLHVCARERDKERGGLLKVLRFTNICTLRQCKLKHPAPLQGYYRWFCPNILCSTCSAGTINWIQGVQPCGILHFLFKDCTADSSCCLKQEATFWKDQRDGGALTKCTTKPLNEATNNV